MKISINKEWLCGTAKKKKKMRCVYVCAERESEIHSQYIKCKKKVYLSDLSVVRNPPTTAGDIGLIPGLGRSTCQGATKPGHHNY